MAIASQYYICNRCRFRTTLFSRIEEHLLEHAGTKQSSPFSYFDCFDHLKALKCPSCDFSTDSLILLRYHLVRNPDQQHFTLKAELKTCKKCRFCTHSNYLWLRHPIFGTCKSKKELKGKKKVKVLKKINGKLLLCEKCDFCTVYLRNMKRHIISKHTHLEKINWRHCKKCPAKFKDLDGLGQHKRQVHASVLDHLHCPKCDYSTPSRQSLTFHFNRKHTRPEDIKWLECYHCGAKFKDKRQLKRHLIRHTTKEKQYKCDQCSYETHRKDSLKRHIITRHLKDDEVKWHKCQYCDYKTKVKWFILKHIQLKHSESVELVQCPYCSFKSKNDNSLTSHFYRFHDDSS